MRTHSSVAVLGIALASAWVAACGSAHDSLPTLGSTGGATILGTVESDGAASSAEVSALSGQSGGLNVSIEGTSFSDTTDNQGRFTFSGLPAGEVTLRFQGPGVDARLTISGLIDGQTLTIVVAVSANSARLLPTSSDQRPENEVKLVGRVESVTPPSLVVAGVTVLTDLETEIKRGRTSIGLAEIQVGDTVKVEGRRLPHAQILAREIKIEGGTTGDEVEFTGLIESITPPSLVVAGHVVLTDANTEFKGQGSTNSLADFSVGDTVKVEGSLNPDSSVLAREVKRVSQDGDDDDDEDDEDDDDEDEDDDDEDDDNSGSGS